MGQNHPVSVAMAREACPVNKALCFFFDKRHYGLFNERFVYQRPLFVVNDRGLFIAGWFGVREK